MILFVAAAVVLVTQTATASRVIPSAGTSTGFHAVSGVASQDAGAIHVSGSSVDQLLTNIAVGGGVAIALPAAPLFMWRRGKMLRPGAGLTASAPSTSSSGVDAALGPFEEFSQSWLCSGEERGGPCLTTSVRVLKSRPAVIWRQEWPLGIVGDAGTPSLGTVNAALCGFPAFASDGAPARAPGHLNSTPSEASSPSRLDDLGFITWASEFAVTPAWRAGVWSKDYGRWQGDWGMYSSALSLFDTSGRTLVVGPLSGFTASINALHNGTGLATGPHGMVERLPAGFSLETVMVLGPGVVGTQMDYGSLLLDTYGKHRASPDVSLAVSALMYSADGYPYYNPSTGNTTCGNYEDVYFALSKANANRAQHLPYHTTMLDSFWYGTFFILDADVLLLRPSERVCVCACVCVHAYMRACLCGWLVTWFLSLFGGTSHHRMGLCLKLTPPQVRPVCPQRCLCVGCSEPLLRLEIPAWAPVATRTNGG